MVGRHKKDGGRLTGWKFHSLSVTLEQAREMGIDVQIDRVMVMTATVVEDLAGRWQPGWQMRSSIICDWHLTSDPKWVETENTMYRLEGEPNNSLPDLGNAVLDIHF